MLTGLVKFAACCRAFGLAVSPGEVVDCARSLGCVDLTGAAGPARFRTVVQAHFVKTVRHLDRFDEVYGLFFSQGPENGMEPEFPGNDAVERLDLARYLDVQVQKADQKKEKGRLSKALLEFLQGDPEPFLARVHDLQIREEAPSRFFKSNLGQLASKLDVLLTANRIRQQITAFPEPDSDPVKAVAVRRAKKGLNRRLDQALDILSREPRIRNFALRQDVKASSAPDQISHTPFSSLSGPDLEKARTLMNQLVKKLKDKAGRRARTRNRGSLDIKKTLRRANRFQGVPLEIAHKKKTPAKAQIIALCDVSGSVWSTARFMLQVLYALEDCFSQIKSFIFVADLLEISDHFADPDIDRAVAAILKNPGINLNQRTDYGSILQAFWKNNGSDLNMKTTLIILGDGRSNYHNPQDHVLENIRERCRRIIWLTPEPGHLWGTGDSEIHTYKRHCHEVRTCMNLKHLSEFVRELVL